VSEFVFGIWSDSNVVLEGHPSIDVTVGVQSKGREAHLALSKLD